MEKLAQKSEKFPLSSDAEHRQSGTQIATGILSIRRKIAMAEFETEFGVEEKTVSGPKIVSGVDPKSPDPFQNEKNQAEENLPNTVEDVEAELRRISERLQENRTERRQLQCRLNVVNREIGGDESLQLKLQKRLADLKSGQSSASVPKTTVGPAAPPARGAMMYRTVVAAPAPNGRALASPAPSEKVFAFGQSRPIDGAQRIFYARATSTSPNTTIKSQPRPSKALPYKPLDQQRPTLNLTAQMHPVPKLTIKLPSMPNPMLLPTISSFGGGHR